MSPKRLQLDTYAGTGRFYFLSISVVAEYQRLRREEHLLPVIVIRRRSIHQNDKNDTVTGPE
jgi:hypothetical protein